jgi:AraC-like DNA-binding protein
MSVHHPYRAVICGKPHIIHGWQGQKLLTDKGSFSVQHIYGGNWQTENSRLFEVAMIQADGSGGWLVNEKPLSFIEKLSMGLRLQKIPDDENLRVYKDRICAVAWVETNGKTQNVTKLLDDIIKSWEKSSLPVVKSDEEPSFAKMYSELIQSLLEINRFKQQFATWSNPFWLTEFRPIGKKIAISPEQKKLAKAAAELQETKAKLLKAEAAAGDNLEEALSKWFRFDPPGMSVDTKARIEKAVKLYVTDREKTGSLSKIAAQFEVSRKTVSLWFKKFREETGFQVVRHYRHESVRDHLQTGSQLGEEEE